MDWDKLRTFHQVALAKSLTRAGEVLHLSQSAVSRQISGLEEGLGVPLFHRHARGLVLTEQGEILLKTVSEMVARFEATQISLAESSARPRGPFKLTVSATFGSMWLAAQLKEFCDLYPEIELTLLAGDTELNLTRREADAAIRFYRTEHPDLVQVPLFTMRNGLYASVDYLHAHGTPAKVADLAQHRLLAYDTSLNDFPSPELNWLFEGGGAGFTPYFRANSLLALRTAVKQGMGIAVLPEYLVVKSRRLTRVLPELAGPVTQAWYTYPVELRNSKRLAVFRNFITQKLAESHF
jgi:DNA-binding transcriptional LysR family regulator